jgi:acetylornithine deacetylase/succinyl-diaminopimelate desuccinylase-like protein
MKTLDAVLNRIDQEIDHSVERLFALLRIASVSTDPAFKDQCRAAAEHVAADLKSIGFEATVRPTAGHPVVVGKSNGAAGPRVLFYGHYDVQPVDPLSLWKTPPFEPRIETLPDGRKIIVARGACDDKGQAMTFIEACRAFKAVTGKLPLPITMMIEGEEECGSKNLFGFVRDNAAEFKLDLALVCDTAMWDQNTPAVTTSLRGLVYEDVKITCADRDLHSGVFGGAAQNPLRLLSQILGEMWDDKGRVTIPGFYDGVKDLPADIKADLKGLDLTAEKFLGPIGLKKPAGELDRMLIEMVTTRPTAEINGMIGGYTGEGAKTVIPGEASAKVSLASRTPRKLATVSAPSCVRGCRRIAKSSSAISASRRRSSCRSTIRRSPRRAPCSPTNGGTRPSPSGQGVPFRSWPTSRMYSAWIRCSSASRLTTTASIRRTRSST